MKEIINQYKNQIKKLLNNKLYVLSLIIVAILGYGYLITHVSIGMDDTCLDRYYKGFFTNNMIAAGRWGSYLIYKLLNIVEFTPFWLEILTVITIMATAVLISSFIIKNIKKSNIGICIVFSCIYISYSIYNEAMIFQPSNFALFLSNLLTIFAVIAIYEIINNNLGNKCYLPLFIVLAISISMYEACCQTYLVGIAVCLLIRILLFKEEDRKIFKYFVIGIGILLISIILNYLLLYIFYFIGVPNSLKGGRTIYWFGYGIKDGLYTIVNIIVYYTIKNIKYFPVLEFLICVIIGAILSIYYSIKNKNTNIFNIYINVYC